LLSKGIEYTRGYSDKAQILKSLSEAYYANGNIVKSFRIYKDYVNANDSAIITNNKELNTKYATKLSSEFEFKNQLEKEQLENQKQNAISNEKLKQQRLVITYSILVLLLIAFISIYIFRILLLTRKQKKTIEDQGLLVIEQKNIVEEKQKEIIDSISYAKRLQDAILPPREFVNKHLVENFIYYKPKDIVAGDFYWAEKAGEMFFIAAADSTGHGVPGAMVSVVCSNALNRAIKEFRLTETGKILDKTRELVLETFEKSASEVKDGMDISLLCIDSKNKNIFWSGANNPLWFIQDNELKEIKADKQPIGKTDYPKPFTTHQIEYKESTTFYLFTDGLADQFGGPNGKKFKYKQFSDLLIKNNNLSQKKQADIIHKAFSDWKGDLEQVDDVCVIGIKL
jgi:serine phosphatase RsbU (regulator of sigma subunit)